MALIQVGIVVQTFQRYDLSLLLSERQLNPDMDPLQSFHNILKESDIFGGIGTSWFSPRSNLLLDVSEVKYGNDITTVVGTVFQSQGASYMHIPITRSSVGKLAG